MLSRGPSLPPQMGRPPMPRPSMSTPQMRHSAPPFRYPAMQGGQTEIRPGVTLQVCVAILTLDLATLSQHSTSCHCFVTLFFCFDVIIITSV